MADPTTTDPRVLRLALRLERIRRRAAETAPAEWKPWLRTMFPQYFRSFAPHHVEFWEWAWAIVRQVRPRPFVGIWARGGGKSTSAETAVAALGVRDVRRYALYVRATQELADKSVGNVASLLESGEVERHYPRHAERAIGKFGSSKGWRRNRLRTAGGFTVDAIGLDTAARGVKVEEQRPDLIVFDDLDGEHDSPHATKKKLETLRKGLLPAGASDLAVLGIQNLIIPHGIFAQLADERADFLQGRLVSGPHPAIEDLETEMQDDPETGRKRAVIIGGTPTWRDQNLEVCQGMVDDIGLSAFLQECQHQVHEREGALWTREIIGRVSEAPPLKRVAVGVDPSGGGDEIGIIAAGLGYDGRGYVLADGTQPGSGGALNWGRKTVGAYDDLEGDLIVAEKNFGGDMVESNIRVAAGQRHVPVKMVSASRGKAVRAEPVSALYADGLVDHVGTFPELEAELTGWVPGDPTSPNRLDALVWTLTELMLEEETEAGFWSPSMDTERRPA